jgi:hypothetical protein
MTLLAESRIQLISILPFDYVLTADLDLNANPNSDLTSTGRNTNNSDNDRRVLTRK